MFGLLMINMSLINPFLKTYREAQGYELNGLSLTGTR